MPAPTDNLTVLFKGGRLSTWHRLSRPQQQAYEQEHVDLMLDISHKHGLQRLEGFRLLTPQKAWERFWLIQFPNLEAAHAWIKAEMAPPYGHYGYYEYYLSRAGLPEYCADWVINPQPDVKPSTNEPHKIPSLAAAFTSAVALLFEREEPEHNNEVPTAYLKAMRQVSHQAGLQKLECFELLTPQTDWHRVWLAELPTLETAETWIQSEKGPAHGYLKDRSFALTRKWAPDYFVSWIAK
jgi:hypothetical protein